MRKAIRDAIVREAKAAEAIVEAAGREDRDLTDVERETVDGHLAKAKELETRGKQEEEFRKQFTDLTAGLDLGGGGDGGDPQSDPAPPSSPASRTQGKNLTLGRAFTESREFKSLLASAPGGQFSEKRRVQSEVFGVKALLTGADHDTSAGAMLQNDYRGMQDPFYQRPLTIRDLFAQGQTTSDTIEYVRLLNVTNNAAPVPEATTSAGPTANTTTGVLELPAGSGIKPESGMTFEKSTTVVKTIAHWIPATKRALSDVAQIRTLIDSFLRYGLEEEFEDQLLAGNGVGENFLGLANVSGIQTEPAPLAGENVFHNTRRARRKVRIGGRAIPSAYVFNPIDWESVELRMDANGRFYGNGPFGMGPQTLWGLPVVESEAVPAGTAYVADWRWGVVYDREQASIQVTDSHADFFIRNLVAILAEMRAAFAVLRPQAFVKITLA
ncbi:MAG: phage major capsid protein [Actinomycetota bacterium]|nr:phage major capsid protein [Actinomycetota bacterium]